MAATSNYIQILPGVLVEYIYTDPSNPEVYSTSAKGLEILNDSFVNNKYLFSYAPNASDLGNLRRTGAVPVNAEGTKYAYLKITGGISYLDFDQGAHLTPYPMVQVNFSPAQNIYYDTVRVHFESGYDFVDIDGYIFEIQIQRRDETYVNISSQVHLKSDSTQLNADPFFIGQRFYTNYIEWKIPSLNYLKLENPTDTNTLLSKLTDSKGIITNSKIKFIVDTIDTTENLNGFSIFNVSETQDVFFDQTDEFSGLVADIQEAMGGDYFELQGLYNGQNYANFIADLNNEPNSNYIVVHQIKVSEQVGTQWIVTTDQMISQLSNFDLPTLFRPVILNGANAVAFSIDYTLRLINQVDGTQIVKYTSLTSNSPKKYGRRLVKLSLGTVPTIANVYNKVFENNGANIVIGGTRTPSLPANTQGAASQVTIKREFITTFRNKVKVRVKSSPAKIQNLNQPGQTNQPQTNT
jgi:hypothetical protein